MSHTVHPYSHRLGIIRDWKSRWFGVNKKYRDYLRGDVLLREMLVGKLRGMYIGGIDIERSEKNIRIIVKTSRPGMLIGRNGEGAVKLKNDMMKFMDRHKLVHEQELKLDIEEIRNPEGNAAVVGYMIAEAIEKRLPYRRVLKQMVEKVMANRDVKGVRLYVGGRLGGAEISRSEELKRGRVPLQTLRADVDFAREKAHMTYGDIGIKVWIYKGEIFKDRQLAPAAKTAARHS